jgi:hypothetical protein
VLNDTVWPPSGRPDAVSLAVSVNLGCGRASMRSVSVVGARATVWMNLPVEGA